MGSSDHDFVIIDEEDVAGTDSSGVQPLHRLEVQKVREWLQPTDYAAESSEYKTHLISYVPGTDVLSYEPQYQQWLESEDHRAVSIKAIPGAGKSVVASNLIAWLQDGNKYIVLFFFFRQIIASNRTPSSLLRDWMAQVLESLQVRLKRYVDGVRAFEKIAFNELWEALQQAICALPRVICVADALDEMSYGNDTFITKLIELGQIKPATVKICMTSRPVPRIQRILRAPSVLELALTTKMLEPAVASYIEHRLGDLPLSATIRSNVKHTLVERSGGLFLYIKLMMDDLLASCPSDLTGLERSVTNLPDGLACMYTRILEEHAARSKVPQRLRVAILRWVTHSARPLRVLELAAIIDSLTTNRLLEDMSSYRSSYPSTKAMTRAACGPLIEIMEDETVCIIHHSLTEYIVDSSRNDSTTLGRVAGDFPTIDSTTSHREMAIICLESMTRNRDIEADDEADGPQSILSTSDPSAYERSSIFTQTPLMKYSIEYWSHHARQATRNDDELIAWLDKFTDNSAGHLQDWHDLKNQRVRKNTKVTAIHIAAGEDLAHYLQHLVNGGAQVNLADTEGWTPLHHAAKMGHENVVRFLIDNKANLDLDDKDGVKPLHLAASGNHAGVVRLLLEAGVDPLTIKSRDSRRCGCGNAARTTGWTPLLYAFSRGHTKAALAFVPYLKPDDLHQALHWAAQEGRSEIFVTVLKNHIIDINRKIDYKTLAYLAAYHHDLEALETLKDLGADFSIGCDDHFEDERRVHDIHGSFMPSSTVLHAFGHGLHDHPCDKPKSRVDSLNVLRFLVESGCAIDAKDSEGNEPLHVVLNKHEYSQPISVAAFVEELLDNGANPCAVNSLGQQALHMSGGCGDTVQALLSRGADVNARNEKDGQTPLHCSFDDSAFENTQPRYIALLEASADCNAQDKEGNTPLHEAVQRYSSKSLERVKTLMAYGADPRIVNRDHNTPFHVMLLTNAKELIEILHGSGADLDARNMEGNTVLMQLVQNFIYHPQMIENMVAAGSQLDCCACAFHTRQTWHVVDFAGNNAFHYLARKRTTIMSGDEQRALHDVLTGLGVSPTARNNLGQLPLHVAAGTKQDTWWYGAAKALPFFLGFSNLAGINSVDNSGLTCLHCAATLSDLLVAELLTKGADPYLITYDGQSLLHIAARARQSNTVGLIAELYSSTKLAMIDQRDRVGRTALNYACTSGRVESVKILLDAEANPNVKDESGITPLGACTEFPSENALWHSGTASQAQPSFTDAVGMCLTDSRRPDVPFGTHRSGSSPWNIESESDSVGIRSIIRLLLASGAIWKDPGESSPLHLQRGSSGNSQLDRALDMGCAVMVDELTNQMEYHDSSEVIPSQDIKSVKRRYLEQLMCMQFRRPQRLLFGPYDHPDRTNDGCDIDVLKCLLRSENDFGISVFCESWMNEARTEDRKFSILATLVEYGYAETLSLIGPTAPELAERIRFGDNEAHSKLKAPLVSACGRALPNLEVISVLVEEKSFDVNELFAADSRSAAKAPLHILAESSHWWKSGAIYYLVDRGAHVNLKSSDGATPLSVAVEHNSISSIEALLRSGADVNEVIDDGTTLLNSAASSPRTLRLLLNHGANVSTGKYPFLFDAIHLENIELVGLALEKGGDVNYARQPEKRSKNSSSHRRRTHTDCLDNTRTATPNLIYPIHFAADRRFNSPECRPRMVAIIQFLLHHGADPMRHQRPDQPILHDLCEHDGIVEPLVENSELDLEARDHRGNTLLLAACLRKHRGLGLMKRIQVLNSLPPLLKTLIDKGANISALNYAKRCTASSHLHQATSPKICRKETSKPSSRLRMRTTSYRRSMQPE